MFTYPDVSHYQAGLSLQGAALVVCKATQGTWYVDAEYGTFKAAAARLRIPLIAYHWLDSTDAVAQARHCYGVVGKTPLMIDDEQNIISVPHTLAFVSAFRALGGVVHLEYAPRWLWQRSGQPDLRPLQQADLFIVASHYGDGTDSIQGWTTYGNVTPTVLQYADAQTFNGRAVDFNAFPGTVDQFMQIATGGIVLEEKLTVGPLAGHTAQEAINVLLIRTDYLANNYAIRANAWMSAETVKDDTIGAAIAALSNLVTAAGGSVEATAIVAAIRDAADEARQGFTELHQELAAVTAQRDALRRRLQAALGDLAPPSGV